jgi:hypothetical protein
MRNAAWLLFWMSAWCRSSWTNYWDTAEVRNQFARRMVLYNLIQWLSKLMRRVWQWPEKIYKFIHLFSAGAKEIKLRCWLNFDSSLWCCVWSCIAVLLTLSAHILVMWVNLVNFCEITFLRSFQVRYGHEYLVICRVGPTTSFLAKCYNEASVANCEDNLATISLLKLW